MVSATERYVWVALMIVVVSLAIPWFLWGNGQVAYGLPVWLWWHVGWMLLSAVVFAGFARRAWGIGVGGAGGERA